MSKVNPASMRADNRALILATLRERGPLSRAQLGDQTSLSKPTVLAIVDELLRSRLVIDGELGEASRAGGRAPRLLSFNAARDAFVAVHVGVNRTSVLIADGVAHPCVQRTVTNRRRTPQWIAQLIRDATSDALAEAGYKWSQVRALTVAVPGPVDRMTGLVRVAPNLGWREVSFANAVAQVTGVPTRLVNIAHAGAVAEERWGIAQGRPDFAWVYLGTGVGSGVMLEGQLQHGERGLAGELGHWVVEPGGYQCGCGRRGCLETVASAAAVARFAREALRGEGPHAALARSSTLKTSRTIDARSIARAAASGDSLGHALFAQVGAELGRAVRQLATLLDLSLVVLGGPFAMAGDVLLSAVRNASNRGHPTGEELSVVASTLGREAELLGALQVGLNEHLSDDSKIHLAVTG